MSSDYERREFFETEKINYLTSVYEAQFPKLRDVCYKGAARLVLGGKNISLSVYFGMRYELVKMLQWPT